MKERVKVAFEEVNTAVPIVKIRLSNNSEGFAVVDTGSESTVFDKDFVKKSKNNFDIKITKEKINLVGVAQNNETPIIYAATEVFFGNDTMYRFGMKGMVISLANLKDNLGFVPAAIIGSDLLEALDSKLDFKKRLMFVSNDISGK